MATARGGSTVNVAQYARVSHEEQAGDGKASIEQQIADMNALCERNGWNVERAFIECKNYVATQAPKKGKVVNPSGERADRPALLEMLDLLRTGELDGVVCWRDDRLVRHPRVAVALEDALDIGDAQRNGKAKIMVVDATGATIDRFTLSIKATIWREENRRRAERVRMGKVATLQQGRWPGSYDRLGYVTTREPGKRGRGIQLADEDQVQTVKDIFDWYEAGVSRAEIRTRLIAHGVEQKGQPGRIHDWSPEVIMVILKCKDYTGRATWSFGDGTEYEIEIPRIIEPEQFARVQARIERNKALATRHAKGVYNLQGIAECGECGSGLSVSVKRYDYWKKSDGTVKRYKKKDPIHRYVCHAAKLHSHEPHPHPYNFAGTTLDWDVWRYIVDNGIKRPDTIKTQILARQEQLQVQGESFAGDIAHARRKLAEVDQVRAFYQRQAARGKISEREFDARMEETEVDQEYWQGELARLQELRDNAETVQSGLDYVTELLTSFQVRLSEIDQTPEELRTLPGEERDRILEERQTIIRALCEKVIVSSDWSVEIHGVLDGTEAKRFGSKVS
jgi:DNA invertase Pin-like site-specific DNA recombinase